MGVAGGVWACLRACGPRQGKGRSASRGGQNGNVVLASTEGDATTVLGREKFKPQKCYYFVYIEEREISRLLSHLA